MDETTRNGIIRSKRAARWLAPVWRLALLAAVALAVVVTAASPAEAAPHKLPSVSSRVKTFKDGCATTGGDTIVITDDDTGEVSAICDGGGDDGAKCTFTKNQTVCGHARIVDPASPLGGTVIGTGQLQTRSLNAADAPEPRAGHGGRDGHGRHGHRRHKR